MSNVIARWGNECEASFTTFSVGGRWTLRTKLLSMRRLMNDENGKAHREMESRQLVWSTISYESGILMDTDEDLQLAISWNRLNLGLLGVWPDPMGTDSGIGKYRFLLPIIVMSAFISGSQSANLFKIWGDVDLITENLATANIPVLNAIMKLFFIWYYRNDLRSLLKSFMEDWRRTKSDRERSIMLKNAMVARKISIGCFILTQTMLTLYLTLRIIVLSQTERNFEVPDRNLLYPAYFPYDITASPNLELTCLGQVLAAYCGTTSYTAVDSFISMMVFHVCGQYTILGILLKELFDGKSAAESRQTFCAELAAIVKRHDHLNQFSQTIENSFNVVLLTQMLSCTVQLCCQGFQVFRILLDSNEDLSTYQLMFLALFVMFIAVHLYVYSYVGEMLIVQSTALSYNAYDSNWFNAPSKEANALILVMHRSTKPLRLTAGKFSIFCLETFSNIIKTSMGYLSVLVAVAGHE